MPSTLTVTTELEAVNTILQTIGEAPVNSLTGTMTADVGLALALLTETNRTVQTQGWSFNTEKDYPLTRDGDGFLQLPLNTLRCDVSRTEFSDIEPVQRGMKLYDRKNHTSVFTRDLEAKKLIVLLEFTELPEAARRYITIRAARVFQDRMLGAQEVHVYTEVDERDAKRVLQADCAEVDDLNVLNSPGVRETLQRW